MNTVAENLPQDQTQAGIYAKFTVTRNDGKDAPGERHHGDEYFVLNLTTDKHALVALDAYGKSCASKYPVLASDIKQKLAALSVNKRDMITTPRITLPNGTVVEPFLVGRYHTSKGLGDGLEINPDNTPWVRVNYDEARQASADAGLSLITELQYLAIAYDISQQPENWTSGKVGEGEIFRGLHQGNVGSAQDGHYESTVETERRWHVLSNGERIYDFSGNVYSWVFDDVQGDENGIIAKPFAEDSPTVTTAPYANRTHGIGDTSIGDGDWSGTALIRGGYWNSGDYAGVFRLSGGWRDGRYVNVSFRCTKSLG